MQYQVDIEMKDMFVPDKTLQQWTLNVEARTSEEARDTAMVILHEQHPELYGRQASFDTLVYPPTNRREI